MHTQLTPAQIIFENVPKKNTPAPQKKPSEPVTLASKTASEFAFDPSQIKELGLPYVPPQETTLDTRNTTQQKGDEQATDPQEEPTEPTHQQHQQNAEPDTHIETQALLASPENRPEPLEENSQTIATTKLDGTLETLEPPNKSTAITPPAHNLPYPANLLKKTTLPGRRAQKTKARLTAAQLTSGFITHLQNNNTDSAITIIGETRTRMPTAQELVYERYGQKLVHCIACAEMAHDKKPPRIVNVDKDTQNLIAIKYDRKNKKHSAWTHAPSGYKEFDDYCLIIVQNALNSFPPAPNSVHPEDDSLFIYYLTPIAATNQNLRSINSWQGHRH